MSSTEANRAYHREYMRKRRKAAIEELSLAPWRCHGYSNEAELKRRGQQLSAMMLLPVDEWPKELFQDDPRAL